MERTGNGEKVEEVRKPEAEEGREEHRRTEEYVGEARSEEGERQKSRKVCVSQTCSRPER